MRIRTAAHLLSVAVGVAAFTPSLQAQAQAAPVGEVSATGDAAASATNNASPARVDASGPRRDASVAGIRTEARETALPEPLQARQNKTSTAATLVIVGGAAFVGGLLINNNAGNAIAVVGLGAALVGLYLWLK